MNCLKLRRILEHDTSGPSNKCEELDIDAFAEL